MKPSAIAQWFAVLMLSIGGTYAGRSDSLKVLREFESPRGNPTMLEWDGENFWIGKRIDSRLYKLDASMTVTDSIDTRRSRVTAFCCKGKDLWFAVDSAAGTSKVNGNRVFRIYRIDPESKQITDSISFAPLVNPGKDTGFIHGLCYYKYKNQFNASVTLEGWNSGTYVIDAAKEALYAGSFVPLLGMSVINNEIWGIKRDGAGHEGTLVAHVNKWPKSPFAIPFTGTDIAYDGNHIFICNARDSKIVEMVTPQSFAVPSADSLKEQLNGAWNWISTTGGLHGATYTPHTEQYSLTLVFTKTIPQLPCDSIGYRIIRNDTLLLSGVAPIALDYTWYYARWIITMESFGHHYFVNGAQIGIGLSDTLTLIDEGVIDGFSSKFAKQTVRISNHPVSDPALRIVMPAAVSLERFTVLGRRLPAHHGARQALSAQIVVSRSKTAVGGIRKR